MNVFAKSFIRNAFNDSEKGSSSQYFHFLVWVWECYRCSCSAAFLSCDDTSHRSPAISVRRVSTISQLEAIISSSDQSEARTHLWLCSPTTSRLSACPRWLRGSWRRLRSPGLVLEFWSPCLPRVRGRDSWDQFLGSESVSLPGLSLVTIQIRRGF